MTDPSRSAKKHRGIRRASRLTTRWLAFVALGVPSTALLFATIGPDVASRPVALTAMFSIFVTAFLAQGGWVALAVAGAAAVQRLWVSTIIAGLAAGIAMGPSGPPVLRALSGPPEHRRGDLVVYSANMLESRSDIRAIAAEAIAIDAGVIVLQEVRPENVGPIESAFGDGYTLAMATPRPDAFGQAVLTRLPVVGVPAAMPDVTTRPTRGWVPQIAFDVSWEDRTVRVVNVHTMPPVGLSYVIDQDAMSRGLCEMADASTADITILAGDFNSDARGLPVKRLLNADLQSAWRVAGRGIGSTWVRPSYGRLLSPQIDHVLFKGSGIGCVEAGVGAANGSDHRPVWARFRLDP